MDATKKNAKTVNKIIKTLHKKGYTVEEAYSILEFTKIRVKYTSKVGKRKLIFSSCE